MDKFSFTGNSDISAIDELYKQYTSDPKSVDQQWQKFFQGFEFAQKNYPATNQQGEILDHEFKVINLIEGYRKRGHLFTKTNPVRTRRKYSPTLALENYGLSESDLDTTFQAGKNIGIGAASLRAIVEHLETTYCQSIGAEYMFIRNPEIVSWLQEKMESRKNVPDFSHDERKHIYNHLKQAVGFENFIHRKFIGQKRFSLEGAEALIPALDAVIEKGADMGIREFILGMSHRGRLNVLANILEKPVEDIFAEFLGEEYDENIALGDVKYHLGYGNTVHTENGKEVRLNLVPNPSHLEAVGPVVQGIAKAKIWGKYQHDYNRLAPIIIHGDAAIASQGVVYETLQMSQLKGYRTGGTIHLVINNQVGFTTNYLDARSSTYCTDIAKVTKSPIFHVNGDDAEALVYTIQLAMEYRQTFHTDVFIDILCYRKHGHNEGDEPRFTQPLLYQAISKHPNPRDIYSKFLIEKEICSAEEIKNAEQEYHELLEDKLKLAQKSDKLSIKQFLIEDWKKLDQKENQRIINGPVTALNKEKLKSIASKINRLPADLKFFKKVEKLMDDRNQMVEKEQLDWGMAELLAYGTLVDEGVPVRVSGQDSERGTFSHRHASLTLEDSDQKYIPLKHIGKKQGSFHIFNSPLSEYGVLGFEYGYAMAVPEGLTIWEAQFGDFNNAAQIIIDQYISSAEEKWGLKNGITLLLPHGYEGQGPEHSSARMERFLALCANNNMQVVNPTTPANFFHVLRRQVHQDFTNPLIVFTPKSLLRHPRCISSLDELADDSFKAVIDDENVLKKEVRRVIFCTGKIYYDLLQKKEEFNARDIALIRVEQLHPWPEKEINKIIQKYPNTLRWIWIQEEPENMGAWRYVKDKFEGIDILPLARLASGSPAVGLHKLHTMGQEEIIGKVFRKCTCELKNKYCGLQCEVGSSRLDLKQQAKFL
ncbi:MAG: 2-oxoglutarate dehydrogenase E1 component [Bacteroidales bacterium]|jgi:2-oxoglutarate dehydrogenase E1 component|nr:2-oxoglutarate dehydrogenase E1 component [Bacteroidales bacterium]